jgi:hypothetical protein
MSLRDVREVAEELGLEAHLMEDRRDAFLFLVPDGRRFTRTELSDATREQIRNTLNYGLRHR